MRNLIFKLAAGAVGGALATYLLQQGMKQAGKLPRGMRPIAPKRDPGDFLVSAAERLIGRLPQKVHTQAAQSMPLVYGVGWPILLAAISRAIGVRTGGRTVAAGAALGALVWAIGYAGWLPATGLLPPVHRVPLGKNASNLASHTAWGALASLPLAWATSRLPN